MTNAQYVRPSNPSNPNPADVVNTFNEQLTYDKNGNIQTFVRNGGMESQTTVPVMDNLVYGYDANEKNKLIKVTDATANTDGFKDGANNTLEYGYDLNGNMTRDDNKGISSIVYNHLNLPTIIIFNNDINTKIEYLYTAVGQKIQKNVFKYHQQITATLIPAPAEPTDYLGGFQYIFEGLQFFPTAEGYVKYTEGASNPFDYVFNYTDHLGNIRLSYGINPGTGLLTKMEENNYYPFGLKHATYNSQARVIVVKPLEIDNTLLTGKTMVQKGRLIDIITPIDPPSGSTTVASSEYNYKYQGQERQDELGLNWDSFKWRNYDYAIGRFICIDPVSEDYAYNSTYAFQENKMGMGRELEGLELDQSPRFGPNVRYINPSDTQTVQNAQNVLKGTGNVVFGAVGAIGSALYSAGTLGAGAALGGGVAFTLSIAEISLGICQINDALSNDSGNVPLQSSSSLPGFVAYSNNNSNAPVIDGVGAFIPGLLSGGNIMGVIEAPKTIMSSTSGTNAAFNVLNATDAVLDTQSAVQGISQFQPVSFPSSVTTPPSQTPSSSSTSNAPSNPFSMYPTQFVQPPTPQLNIPRN